MAKNPFDFVLDCSITMAWCFDDESNEFTDSILAGFKRATAIVPTIWPLEVANVLLLARKNKRLNDMESARFIDSLSILPIIIDPSTSSRAMHSVFVLAGQTGLTIYDAAYLELAIREEIPLLTLDKKLIEAAKKLAVPITLKK